MWFRLPLLYMRPPVIKLNEPPTVPVLVIMPPAVADNAPLTVPERTATPELLTVSAVPENVIVAPGANVAEPTFPEPNSVPWFTTTCKAVGAVMVNVPVPHLLKLALP